MPPSPRRPQAPRQQWLLTLLVFGALLSFSFYLLTSPTRMTDEKFQDARTVSISEITRGYREGEFTEITVRDNRVFAVTATGAALQSYKEPLDTVSQLGWNDPENPTVVTVHNTEAANLLMALLPDIMLLVLVIAGIVWLFRGIARSQSSAMSFGKSRARIADGKQVKTRFKDVAGADEA